MDGWSRGRSLAALSLYSLLAGNRGSLFTVFFALFLVQEKGATIALSLAMLSAAYVGASLLAPLIGRVSDRMGRRKIFLMVGEGLSLPLFLSVPFLPGYVAAGAAFVAAELVLSIGSPATNAYVVDVSHAGERGKWYGMLGAANALGAAIGFPVTGLLIGIYGFNALFLVSGAVMVGAFLTVWLLLPDAEIPQNTTRRPLKEMKGLTVFSFTVSIRAIGWGAVVSFYGTFAYVLGATTLDVGLIAMSGWIVGAIISTPMGKVVDRMGELRPILIGSIISLGAMMLFLATTTWTELIPAQVVYRVGFALMSPAMLAWVGRIAPSGRRAEYMGFFTLINSTLWSLGPFAGALAFSLKGATGLFLFSTVATLITILAIPILYRSDIAGPGKGSPGNGRDREVTS